MANPEHLDVVAHGSEDIAHWRAMHPGAVLELAGAQLGRARLEAADLSGADLTGACLDRADLRGANLCRATLRNASLVRADLSDADVNDADLAGAALQSADLSRADLTGAELSDADLSGAFAIDAELTRARLMRANLTSAHLTRARLIEADLTDAVVENSVVSGTVVERLVGRPQPATVLWFDDEPRALVTETGILLARNDPETPISPDRAQNFFIEPQVVELVWERSFSEAAMLAYSAFQAAALTARGWPDDVRFLAGVARRGRMVFLYEAPRDSAVIEGLQTLLEPFRLAEFIDFQKTARAWSRVRGQAVTIRRSALANELKSLAHKLQAYEGFADNLPVELNTADQRTAIEYRGRAVDTPAMLNKGISTGTIEFDVADAQPVEPGAGLLISLQVAQADADGAQVRFCGLA